MEKDIDTIQETGGKISFTKRIFLFFSNLYNIYKWQLYPLRRKVLPASSPGVTATAPQALRRYPPLIDLILFFLYFSPHSDPCHGLNDNLDMSTTGLPGSMSHWSPRIPNRFCWLAQTFQSLPGFYHTNYTYIPSAWKTPQWKHHLSPVTDSCF